MSFSEDPKFSESFNLSELIDTPEQDEESLQYHAEQGGGEEEPEQEGAPKKTRGKAIRGVLGTAAVATALVGHTIFSAASDDDDIDEGGVIREAAIGEKGAAPAGDQGAYDVGGDYGTGTGGGEYMPQGAPGDGGGGTFVGGDGGGAYFPAGTQTGAAPPPDGGATFVDVGGVHISPQTPAASPPTASATTAAPPPPATNGSAPPPNLAQ